MRAGRVGSGVAGEFANAVARAFDEEGAGDGGEAAEVLHREAEWCFNQTVEEEAVSGGVDGRDAGVVALEVERGRRDGAEEVLEGSAAGADADGFCGFASAASGFFERTAVAVGTHGEGSGGVGWSGGVLLTGGEAEGCTKGQKFAAFPGGHWIEAMRVGLGCQERGIAFTEKMGNFYWD